jgi:hypothetical protein
MWLIDHGICFHAEDKLRTVIGILQGKTPGSLCKDLRSFRRKLAPAELVTALKPTGAEDSGLRNAAPAAGISNFRT